MTSFMAPLSFCRDPCLWPAADPGGPMLFRIASSRITSGSCRIGVSTGSRKHEVTSGFMSHAFDVARKRRTEIGALVRYRHGRLPNTDDRSIYLEAAARHLPPGRDPVFALENWARQVGAVLPYGEIQDAIDSVRGAPRLRADTQAKELQVTDRERTALRLVTIGSIDVDKRERARRRKARKRIRDRERNARKRAAKGATPRAQWLAGSISRLKPWEAMGISRRTYYRRNGTGVSPTIPALNGRRTCATARVVSRRSEQPVLHRRKLKERFRAKDGVKAALEQSR
jgi:hypothetical protein